MTEPDEALLWAREQLVTFWEKAPGVRAADRAVHINNARSGASDGDLEEAVTGRLHWLDGNRAGAAASAERIKELEAEVRELKEALAAVVMEATARNVPITTDTIRFSAPIRALLKETDQ